MIKPVYFGKEEIDRKRFEYANTISNFSEWVKIKIDEDIGIVRSGTVDNKNSDIEMMIRKIIKEEIIYGEKTIGDEKVDIDVEIEEKDKIEIGGWTL